MYISLHKINIIITKQEIQILISNQYKRISILSRTIF